jgi:hypothetical protein
MYTLATFQASEIGVWLPFAALAAATIIVFLALYFRHERRRLWHETARTALANGQPVPTDGETNAAPSSEQPPRSPLRDIRTALILLAVSVGLYLEDLNGCYITGGIGVALLVNAAITALFSSRSTEASSRQPHA